MAAPIKNLSISGFKSIQAIEGLELGSLNILIGSNGAGKSNFVDFFRMLRAMADQSLGAFVQKQGGADGFFFLGPKNTPQITAHLRLGKNEYEFSLEPTATSDLLIARERMRYVNEEKQGSWREVGRGTRESGLKRIKDELSGLYPGAPGVGHYVYDAVSSWMVYHFHDTSSLSPMRREQSVRDFDYLRPDASNLAAYLLNLQLSNQDAYLLIRDTVRLVAPFFDDFRFRPEERGETEKVRLEWTQQGTDFPFQPSQLSDGTIRFICLATALLQPILPATIVIDEPELGLHPHALELLAGLLKKAAARTQVIVSTQSAPLLSQFGPEDIIVVSRRNEASEFQRLDGSQFSEWLDEYTLGELWQKNYIEGASNA